MNETKRTFKEWIKDRKEKTKEAIIRFDTLSNTAPEDQHIGAKTLLRQFKRIEKELYQLYDMLQQFYENEIEKHKPTWEWVARWVEQKREEESEKRKFR